jgi:pimeloyl-ACP methyl ester carboxylesterase
MLARSLAVLLALELGLYCIAGVWLWSAHGLSPRLAVLAALASALAVRFALVALSFALAHVYRGQVPATVSLAPRRRIKLYASEFLAFTLLFTLIQPLAHRLVTRPDQRTRRLSIPAIVLIPGIYCNAGAWWWMRRRLEAAGLSGLFAATLEPPLASIDELASQLSLQIESLCATTGARRVVLVGHSMGGLIARTYIRNFGGAARVAKLITLASPHHGSALARWAVGLGGQQLRPGHPWLAKLNANESEPSPVPIVSLFSWHDNLVVPQSSAELVHADSIAFVGIGHLSLLFSDEVARRLYQEISAATQK